jgi:hypothetical protein
LESVNETIFYAFWHEIDVFGCFSGFGIHLLFFDESRGHRFAYQWRVASSTMRVAMGDTFRFNQLSFFFESVDDGGVDIQDALSGVIIDLFVEFSIFIHGHKESF